MSAQATPAEIVFINRVYQPDLAATSRLLSDLVTALACERGFRLRVICARTAGESAAIAGVSVHRVPVARIARLGVLGRLLADAAFLLYVGCYLLLSRQRPGLIVAKTDPPMLQVIVGTTCRLRGRRYICWHQDLYPEVAERLGFLSATSPLARLLRRWRDWAVAGAWQNVVIGEAMRDYLGRAGRTRLISNWALNDERPEAAAEEVAHFRALAGAGLRDTGAMVLGHCGNLGRAHPVEPLLGLAAHYGESGPRVLITGGGVHYMRLRRFVAGNRHWSFLPFQPEERLPALLAAVDVHLVVLDPTLGAMIVPSKYIAVLAAGRPSIFIGDPEDRLARRIVAAGAGFAVAADDAPELIRVVESLRDPARRADVGAAARRLYETQFSRRVADAAWSDTLREGLAA